MSIEPKIKGEEIEDIIKLIGIDEEGNIDLKDFIDMLISQ